MNRTLSVERTYALAQYQNIKLHDSLEIPEEYALDPVLVNKFRYLQLLQLEIDYKKYVELMEKTHKYTPSEAIDYLEEGKVNILDEIYTYTKEKGE
jgi:hypothetical protein